MTVRQSLELIAEMYRLPRKVQKKRVGFLSELFEVESFLDQKASTPSLGERMRCEIVAGLLHHPSALLADEPTIGLDVVGKNRFRSLLRRWRLEEKATLLLTSHDCSDIEALCERAILIDHGEIHYDQALHHLKSKQQSIRQITLNLSAPMDCKDRLKPFTSLLIEDLLLTKTFRIDLETTEISQFMHELSCIYKETLIDIAIERISLEAVIANFFERRS